MVASSARGREQTGRRPQPRGEIIDSKIGGGEYEGKIGL